MNNPTAFVTLAFPDGTELSGKSADDVLLAVGRLQWNPVEDLAEVKRLLANRAEVWTGGNRPDHNLPSDEFLTALDARRFCAVIWAPHPAKRRGLR